MHRTLALFGVLLAVTLCSIGGWGGPHRPPAVFIAPGATDVQLRRLRWNEWQISYQASGSPALWYTEVPHQLEMQHWGSPDRVEYGSLSRTYSRRVPFACGELWEWAFLSFDPLRPHDVHIYLRRWIAVSVKNCV